MVVTGKGLSTSNPNRTIGPIPDIGEICEALRYKFMHNGSFYDTRKRNRSEIEKTWVPPTTLSMKDPRAPQEG